MNLTAGWQLWRLDDHGNAFLVGTYSTKAEAEAACASFEAKRHKQSYWVQECLPGA